MLDETKLVQKAKKGDNESFSTLYREYRKQIYKYVFSYVGDQTSAEEITSQTFLAVLEGLPRYRHKSKFAAWLFSIARNKVMDHFRHESRLNGNVDEDAITVMNDPEMIENIISAERASALSKVIKELPADRKELLRLRFAVCLTYKEIGQILNRHTEAVKKATYRLLDDLKQSLEKYNE